jgi:hypothetical protein
MQDQLWEPRAAVRVIAVILGVLGLALGSVPPTHAQGCGDVLGPGGYFRLEQDLTCPDVRGALTLRDGAILDLNGHTVTCSTTVIGCVVLTGQGAQLWNGTVARALHNVIVLEGTGGHVVWNVTSNPPVDGNTLITSDHNWLINVKARGGTSPTFDIMGHNNRLIHSQAHCSSLSFDGCIAVLGDENYLIDNIVTVDTDTGAPPLGGHGGISISGNKNWLLRNHVTNSDGPGIVVHGTGNNIQLNSVHSTTIDLADTNGDCTHNTWKHNFFKTSDPPCIR